MPREFRVHTLPEWWLCLSYVTYAFFWCTIIAQLFIFFKYFIFKGEIGVLGRRDMDNFAAIFLNYQNLGKCKDDANSQF